LLRPTLRHDFIEIVPELLISDDVAQRISDVGIARDRALRLRIVNDGGAFVLDRSEAEAGNFDLFLIRLVRRILVEQKRELFGVLRIGASPPSLDALYVRRWSLVIARLFDRCMSPCRTDYIFILTGFRMRTVSSRLALRTFVLVVEPLKHHVTLVRFLFVAL